MRKRFLPVLSVAALALSAVTPAFVAAAGTGLSPLSAMDHHRMAATDYTAPRGNYGLRTCQVGLSIGQCYDPYQMRHAYGVDSLIANGNDGTGKTIVIVDAFGDPNIQSQLDTFDAFYGLPNTTIDIETPDGSDGYSAGWAEEISLDVEWAHAIAPGANIVLEIGHDNSDEGLVSALNDAINNNRGDVVSMSFGESDQCLGADLTNAWHQAFVNATKKGITLFASSGDQGALQPSCDGNSWIKSTSAPASDPLVTSVGGTELHAADYCLTVLGCDPTANPAPGTWLSEIAWNEGDPYGDYGNVFGFGTLASGGGYSTIWDAPSYQQGTNHGNKQAGVPDVAYNAAVLHGVLVYLNVPGVPPGWYRFGGTSAGAPQWAALTAIADQMAGHDLGFLNRAIYTGGQASGYSSSFHDITSGTNSAAEFDSDGNVVDVTGYDAGNGWDAVTGFGTPKANNAVPYLVHHVSAGDATAIINGSKPHAVGNGHGHQNPN